MIYDTESKKGKQEAREKRQFHPYRSPVTRSQVASPRGNERELLTLDDLLNPPVGNEQDIAMEPAPDLDSESSDGQRERGLSFHAFNLNHFGGGSESDPSKIEALRANLQIFAVTHPEMGSMLMAPIHTSPSSSHDVATQAGTYATTTKQVAEAMAAGDPAEAGPAQGAAGAVPPFMLLGDFYNPPASNQKQFEDGLGEAGMTVQRPGRLTNIAKKQKDQEKLPADYFISSKDSMTITDIQALDPPSSASAVAESPNAAAAWKEQGISDHAPVAGNASWNNEQMDHEAFLAQTRAAVERVKRVREGN